MTPDCFGGITVATRHLMPMPQKKRLSTNFMMGGMKVRGFLIFASMITSLRANYDIDIYVNKQWRGKYDILLLRIIRMTPVYITCINASGDKYTSGGRKQE